MKLNGEDIWGHFAPLFHLVDVFAVYAITLVGGRHVIVPTFSAQDALLTIGEKQLCTAAVVLQQTTLTILVFAC